MDDVLKRIFLRSLPPAIVTAITGSLSAKFDIVMEAADRAWTAAAARPATVSVSAISGPPGSAARGSRLGGRQRGPRSSGQVENLALCSFHRKFSDAARKCVTGCSRWNEDRLRNAPVAHVLHVEETLDGENAQEDTALGNA